MIRAPNGALIPALPGAGLRVVALFDYATPADEGELAFKKDDVIIVIERGGDGAWWSGMNGDKVPERSVDCAGPMLTACAQVGLFPSNFFSLDGKRIGGGSGGEAEVCRRRCARAMLPLDERGAALAKEPADDGEFDADAVDEEIEREARQLEELEKKRAALASEREKKRLDMLKAEQVPAGRGERRRCVIIVCLFCVCARVKQDAERAAAEERGRLAREKEALIGVPPRIGVCWRAN